MMFVFRDLDDATREQMLAEFREDVAREGIYLSARLSPAGRAAYPGLLESALTDGDAESFAGALGMPGVLNTYETARNPRGGPDITKRVASNAASTLAQGEFNRYFVRGLCRRVVEAVPDGTVRVYRARVSARPRAESDAKVDTELPARQLLEDLRSHMGVDTALGLPEVNSGLSVCMP